jgi:hypothetical protein
MKCAMDHITSIECDIRSKYGEDGVFDYLCESIRMTDRFFFSVPDYSRSPQFNPMINLVTSRGFTSCIAGSPNEIAAIAKQTPAGLREVLDNIVSRSIQVFHVDTGYNDFWILKHCMQEFERRKMRPWIVCVPFNPSIPLHVACSVPWRPKSQPDGPYHTCSLLALVYTLPGYVLFGCTGNRICYFVLAEHAHRLKKLNSTINTPQHVWNHLSRKFWVSVCPRVLSNQ